ncbi:MAG: hypothetical protein M3362_22625 [Acidobacteriota bacterium]|nr:hypothetical protein [Acidobacteriota bacterium]
MKKDLADYILCLSEDLEHTHHANDRPLYEKYLADAAVLLALVERGVDVEELRRRVQNHERLLSNTWLVGDEHKSVLAAWQKFKTLLQ